MPVSGHWRPGELVGSGTVYAVAAVAIPLTIGGIVAAATDRPEFFGGYMIGALCVAIGVVLGSTVNAALGVLLCGLVTATETFPIWATVLIGSALFTTMVLFDLSMTARRGSIDRPVLRNTLIASAAVIMLATALAIIVWNVATARTWSSYLLPFAILSMGVAVQVASRVLRDQFTALRHQRFAESNRLSR